MRDFRAWVAGVALLVAPALARAAERPYPIVDTGQTACYDDRRAIACPGPGQPFFGQDAQHVGAPPSYRDLGDGTIADRVTGLMWEKGFRQLSWADAEAQARASRTGGHADWRVPTIKELYSLIDFSGSTGSAPPASTSPPADAKPYLDRRMFEFDYPRQGRFIDAQYISRTVYTGITMGRDRSFFGVNFADGRIKAYPIDGGPGRRGYYVRFVRGNPEYGRNDFHDPGDGTILDRATGLVWTKGDSGALLFRDRLGKMALKDGRLDWREALAFCAGLEFAQRRDWRLPNAKELHSLVDYQRPLTLDPPVALDPAFAISLVRESDGSPNGPYHWTSTTHLDGREMGSFAVYIAFGKAMGNLSQGGMGGMGPPMGMMGPMVGRPPPPPPPPTGEQMGPGGALRLLDVHGAGAQRSSPKSGDESRLPLGAGPQGDVLRIYNFVRCVRG